MKTKIIPVNIMILIAFLSCSSGKYFTNYYTGNYTGLDTLINLQGYYLSSSCDPFYYTMTMFYNSGLAIHWTISEDNVSDFAINLFQGKLRNKYAWLWWGSYVIKDDTIKLQTDMPGSFLYPSGTFILYSDFKILPDRRIQLVSEYLRGDSWHYDQKIYSTDCNKPSKFFPLETKADSTKCPLLKKKWFWNNEENRKAYMKETKEKK